MLRPEAFVARRHHLQAMVPGPILLLGMGERPRNLPMNSVPFRQDSSFLYLTGCALPGAAALLDTDGYTLFLPEPADDDVLWHGQVASMTVLKERYRADRIRPAHELEATVRKHGTVATLAVADHGRTQAMSAWTGTKLSFGEQHGDEALVNAIIHLRRTKSEAELDEMRTAAQASALAHRAVMASTHPGYTEEALATLFEAVLRVNGCALGYSTILSQDGEILHNHSHHNILEAGRLVLCDGGGEVASGYGADVTRTWPVSGRFSGQQRAAYTAVLEAQTAAIACCTASTRYRKVHDAASLVLCRFLVDEGLLRGNPEDLVERGAHAMFFPHGTGHHLGLDVHDLENFGDLPSYEVGAARPEAFGTCYLRLDLPLEPNWVVTVEPGFYMVPSILRNKELRERFSDVLVDEVLRKWEGFGGIRIEDDIRVTSGTPEVLTSDIPRAIDAVEALIGTRPAPESYLRGV